MTWPSGDPNQPPAYQHPGPQYPPPPPLPYQQNPYGPPPGQYGQPQPGYPYAPPPKKSRKGLIIGLSVAAFLIAACVVGAAVFFIVATKDKVIATDLAVGDCLTEIPDSSRVLYVKTVSCDQPHKGEVFAVLPLPDGDFPGDAAVVKYADKCAPALDEYAPNANSESGIQLFVLYPTADSWQRGDRTVTCIATSKNPRTGKIE